MRFEPAPWPERSPIGRVSRGHHATHGRAQSDEDEWLRGGGTMIFCTEAPLASHVHELLAKCRPTARTLLLLESAPASERVAAIDAFRRGDARTLVCTDVASRGLDLNTARHEYQSANATNENATTPLPPPPARCDTW